MPAQWLSALWSLATATVSFGIDVCIISQSTDPLLRRYSFDYGNVHVIQFSSEHNWLPGSEQYLSVMIWSLLNIGLIVTTGGSKLICRLSTAQ